MGKYVKRFRPFSARNSLPIGRLAAAYAAPMKTAGGHFWVKGSDGMDDTYRCAVSIQSKRGVIIMRTGISRFSVLQQMVFLALVCATGLIVVSTAAFSVIGRVKVTGPIYQQIVQGKDLVADILPPPEYIIESYLVVLQAERESDKAKLPQYLDRFKKLKGEYDERHAFWIKELAEGEAKQLLVESSFKPAVSFYESALNEFFPALQAGDAPKAAQSVVKLTGFYEAHRAQIDKLVELTNAKELQIEKETAGLLKSSSILMLSLCLLVTIGCLVLSGLIIRSIRGTFAA